MTRTLYDIFGLEGKTALVTGSSRGIGAAIAEGMSAAGAEVVVHARSLEATKATCTRIVENGGTASPIEMDLSTRGSGTKLIVDAEELYAKVDILVINASAQVNAPLADLTDKDFEFQINVNLRSTIEMLQTSLPRMAARGWGRVVSIGSVNQARPKAIVTAYAATKAAQHNLIQSQAREYAPQGVLLNTLAPGLVDTDRNAARKTEDPEGWLDYARQLNWMQRAGTPSEMVGAAVFLASDACSFMTGEEIFLTGGY